jgi:hypothetical protein
METIITNKKVVFILHLNFEVKDIIDLLLNTETLAGASQ